jgi:DNA-directed RNA polymerase specialized sigma24 family protein
MQDEHIWGALLDNLNEIGRGLGRLYPGIPTEDIEDAIGTILVKLQNPRTLAKVRASQSLRAYLLVMLRHAVLDTARSSARRRRLVEGSPRTTSYDPSKVALDSEEFAGRVERLRSALSQLGP